MKDKRQVIEEVSGLLRSFADRNLSNEENTICRHIWEKLARKRTLDITRTRSDIWASAVIWSFCRANFKYEEGVDLDFLCSFFHTKKSTVGNKASEISRMLKIDFFNPEFTTERIQEENPLNRLEMTNDGLIVLKETSSPTEEQLSLYRHLRSVQMGLNHVLTDTLPQDAVRECGMKLGIYRDNALIFGSQSEMDVLMDYCLYDYRWGGSNAIEKYASLTPFEPGSDERVVLDAMLNSRYSLFQVDEVRKGFGVQTRDLFRGDGGFIMDIAFSETAIKGAVLACRIISPAAGFSMGTGAGLPVDRVTLKRIADEIPERFGATTGEIARISPQKASEFSASIIGILLEGDAGSHIRREDVVSGRTVAAMAKVGRNDLCPCGSGKKYKKCCGR